MGWLDRTAFRWLNGRLERLYAQAADPGPVQARLLLGLVRRARDTEFGRAHHFAEIASAPHSTVRDFQSRVPLATFDDVRPLWQRIEAGEPAVTWPGRTRYFAMTAGTTHGSKHVPVTADAIRSNRAAGAIVAAVAYRAMGRRDVTSGRFLYLGGSTTLTPTGAGGWFGDASGIMNAHVPFFARRYHLPGRDVAAMVKWEEKIERVCRDYLEAPVNAVTGLPSWLVPLFEQLITAGRERLGERVKTVADVWPRLGVLLSFGMALRPYRAALEVLAGRPLVYLDTYSSSEGGMTAIQDRPDQPGMLVLVNNGVFYEFIREDEADRERPRRFTLAEVELDVPYEVVLTTNGGIWAFRLGDVVRFVTLRPHRLVVMGRTAHVLNAFGEHLIGEELEAAVVRAAGDTGADVAEFAVEAVPPQAGGERGRHRWYVEFRRPPGDPAAFMAAVDRQLTFLNEDYASYRKGDLAMAPPDLVPLAPGAFYQWMKVLGRLGGQFKVPRVLTDAALACRLKEVADTLAPET